MDQTKILSLLQEPVILNGIPVKETAMFQELSSLSLSDQRANDYICSLHNHQSAYGTQAAEEKVLLVFRIHPLVAVRTLETSSMAADMGTLAYAFKILFLNIRKDYDPLTHERGHYDHEVILNDDKVRYLIMLIEASFQNSVCEVFDSTEMLLSYVLDQERELYQSGQKKWTMYLTNRNVQEIITHIPENRQIELINWFWKRHLHAFRKYKKTDTFVGRKVAAMMEVLPEGALWRHLENAEKEELSPRERAMTERERKEIADFIRSVVVEERGRHIEYVERVLGKTDFYEKLEVLLGPDFRKEYDRRKR